MTEAIPATARVVLERDGDIATIRLSNPGKLNAINLAMWRELTAAVAQVAADPGLRCLVVRGAGDEAFAAGGDIEEFLTQRATLEQAMAYHEAAVAPALTALAECPIPSVAMIHGACIGGGLEIACCCDLRLAGATAKFGAPINKLGFSMYPGEMQRVLAVATPVVAAEILLEGRILSAAEALAKGLLTRVVADAELAAETAATVRRIAQGAPLVARWHKQWMRRLAEPAALTEAEKRAAFAFLDSEDYQEGLRAFFEKRPPAFRGR